MKMQDFIESGGTFLKKEDLGKARPVCTIAGIDWTDMDEGKPKPVVRFRNKEKALVLNKTNARILAEAFGMDDQHWIGQQVELWVDPYVTYAGKVVGGIKVTPISAPVPASPPDPQAQAADDLDDDIPF